MKLDTAAYLRGVGLHFIPEPPSSCAGEAVVIVCPHIGWQRGRAVIIDAYGSHLWKRPEGLLGDKRKV